MFDAVNILRLSEYVNIFFINNDIKKGRFLNQPSSCVFSAGPEASLRPAPPDPVFAPDHVPLIFRIFGIYHFPRSIKTPGIQAVMIPSVI